MVQPLGSSTAPLDLMPGTDGGSPARWARGASAADTLNAILADKAKLTAVLTYHVVAGKVLSSDLATVSAARTAGFDVRWRPFARLELSGTTASTVAKGGLYSTTRSASGRWQPHASVQLVADWSRNSDLRAAVGTQAVTGREVWSLHALALVTRKLQLDAAAGVADRGTERENRQGTLTLTWAFGR